MAFDGDCDTSSAVVERLKAATSNLIDPETEQLYSDLTLDSTSTYVLGSVENQKKVLIHITDASKDSGAIGVCTWGGETRDWPHGMFTWTGQAFDSLDFFKNYSPE